MKSKMLGIIAIIVIIGFGFNACGGGNGSNPLSATYISYDSDGSKYTLVVTENPNRAVTYTPQSGDTYVMTITSLAGSSLGTSTGSVVSVSGSTTLSFSLALGSSTFTITVTGGTIESIVDPIPLDGGGTRQPPATLTQSPPETSGGDPLSTVATPTANPAAGNYNAAQIVTLSTTTTGANIYYTTDGNTPTTSSTLYTNAINISVTTTLKAIAVKEGMNNSGILTAAYTISSGDGDCQNNNHISCGVDGIYYLGCTGPGGGKIFYVSTEGFTVLAGTGFNEYTAYYLEVAPEDAEIYGNPAPWGAYSRLISGVTISSVSSFTSTSDAEASLIGNGRKDTQLIITFLTTISQTDMAAQFAFAYRSPAPYNTVDDWFLPSIGELSLLYQSGVYRSGVNSMSIRTYWSSSQSSAYLALAMSFSTSNTIYTAMKLDRHSIRAIRAF